MFGRSWVGCGGQVGSTIHQKIDHKPTCKLDRSFNELLGRGSHAVAAHGGGWLPIVHQLLIVPQGHGGGYVYLHITRFLGPGHSRFLSAPGSGQWGDRGSFLDSGRTFEIPAELSRFWSNVRDSGRTFERPVERSNFRPNARNSGRTLGKMEMKNWSFRAQKGLPEFLVEANFMF